MNPNPNLADFHRGLAERARQDALREAELSGLVRPGPNDHVRAGDILYRYNRYYGVDGFNQVEVLEVLPNGAFKIKYIDGPYKGEKPRVPTDLIFYKPGSSYSKTLEERRRDINDRAKVVPELAIRKGIPIGPTQTIQEYIVGPRPVHPDVQKRRELEKQQKKKEEESRLTAEQEQEILARVAAGQSREEAEAEIRKKYGKGRKTRMRKRKRRKTLRRK